MFESLILSKWGVIHQSTIKFDFTAGLSSLMTSLESCHNRRDLMVVTLDTQKAIDVVVHSNLIVELAKTGMTGGLWLAIIDSYDGVSEGIVWGGQHSNSVLLSSQPGPIHYS